MLCSFLIYLLYIFHQHSIGIWNPTNTWYLLFFWLQCRNNLHRSMISIQKTAHIIYIRPAQKHLPNPPPVGWGKRKKEGTFTVIRLVIILINHPTWVCCRTFVFAMQGAPTLRRGSWDYSLLELPRSNMFHPWCFLRRRPQQMTRLLKSRRLFHPPSSQSEAWW